jgi:hypothetical protein
MNTLLKYLVLLILLVACEEEHTVVQGFETSEMTVAETSGLQNIVIDLGDGLSTTTNFTITVSGTAGMEADFIISNIQNSIDLGNGLTKVSGLETNVSTSAQIQFVVIAGQKSLTVPIKIIDDGQIEPGLETIKLNITSISETGVDLINTSTTVFIGDADVPPPGKVQIDLSWEVQPGGSINTSNFDLYLARKVSTGNSINNYELISGFSAIQTTGFETLTLDNSLPNEKYYVLIKYLSGSSLVRIKLVISQDNSSKSASGQVGTNQVGSTLFFGPISKSSSGFAY